MKINLHHHLLQKRRNAAAQKPVWWERAAWVIAGFVMNRPNLFALGVELGRFGQFFHPLVKGGPLDPARAWTENPRPSGAAV